MQKISVLIVDDHAILRDGLKIAINTDENLMVAGEASEGKEAIELIDELDPTVVVMDVNMPGMNGIETVKEIRKKNKSIKILMLTMHEDEDYIFDAISSGVDGYIFKMSDMELFIEAVKTVATGQNYYAPKVSETLIDNYKNKQHKKHKKGEQTPLTKREKEILKMISDGETTNNIAEKLFISFFTVSKHRKNIMKKLKVKNTAELVKYAFENKLV
ncbi:MAG: response regulator [Rhodothermaceae bacterium]